MRPVDPNAINPPEQTQVQKAASARTNAPDSYSPTPSSETDRLSMSHRAEEVSRRVARARELPKVRQDRVEVFKQLIDSDDYNRSSRVIADAIIANERSYRFMPLKF